MFNRRSISILLFHISINAYMAKLYIVLFVVYIYIYIYIYLPQRSSYCKRTAKLFVYMIMSME